MHQDDKHQQGVDLAALWRLLRYSLAYPRLLKEAGVLLLLATAGQVLGPVLVKIFLDDYVSSGQYPVRELSLLATAYVFSYGLSAWAGYQNAMRFNKVAFSVVRTIRSQVFASVMRKPLAYFDHRPAGALVSRITNDTEAIKELFVQVMSSFIQNITLILAVFIAMAYLDVRLMLLCSIILPVVLVVMYNYQRLSSPRYHRARSVLSHINATISEAIQGMRIVQMLNQQARFSKQFRDTSQDYFNARMSNMRLDAMMLRPLPDLLRTITLAGVLYYFGSQSFSSAVEIGVIYAFINYLSRITEPVLEMTQRLSLLQQAVVAGERVFGIIDEANEEQALSNGRIGAGQIQVENLSFSYTDEHPVLQDINFSVQAGQFFAIVGHTGSGKSTLMSLLLRFYPVRCGKILIDGTALEDIDQHDLRAQMGVVLQDPFISASSVRDNITLGLPIAQEQVEAAAKTAQLHDYIMGLPDGYDTKVGERGLKLSGGEKQRVAIARTLLKNPRIVILDEATSALDTRTEQDIQAALRDAARGRTTLVIAHRLSTVVDADEILVLQEGQVAERGSHAALIAADGLYAEMWRRQSEAVAAAEAAAAAQAAAGLPA